MITEQLLRNCVKEAQDKGQFGLLIWSSWKIWDNFASDMEEKNENHDYALEKIKEGEIAAIDFVMGGFLGLEFMQHL